jgi:hypothetical protein
MVFLMFLCLRNSWTWIGLFVRHASIVPLKCRSVLKLICSSARDRRTDDRDLNLELFESQRFFRILVVRPRLLVLKTLLLGERDKSVVSI